MADRSVLVHLSPAGTNLKEKTYVQMTKGV